MFDRRGARNALLLVLRRVVRTFSPPPRSPPSFDQRARPAPCSTLVMRIGRAAAATLFLLTIESAALALPRPGERFPNVSAQDLTGQTRSTEELVGKRALVVVITDREAINAARAWYMTADARVPANVARESLVSLRLPFFISTPFAQKKAREQVPRQHWAGTLLDRGDMARNLGTAATPAPYVFVLDESGRVVAAVHGTIESPQAEEIWSAASER
jgi:hypothetical protein